jgi:hypothetical protein
LYRSLNRATKKGNLTIKIKLTGLIISLEDNSIDITSIITNLEKRNIELLIKKWLNVLIVLKYKLAKIKLKYLIINPTKIARYIV